MITNSRIVAYMKYLTRRVEVRREKIKFDCENYVCMYA